MKSVLTKEIFNSCLFDMLLITFGQISTAGNHTCSGKSTLFVTLHKTLPFWHHNWVFVEFVVPSSVSSVDLQERVLQSYVRGRRRSHLSKRVYIRASIQLPLFCSPNKKLVSNRPLRAQTFVLPKAKKKLLATINNKRVSFFFFWVI